MWGDIAIAFLLAFIITFMATPYTIKIAKKVGAVDVPKDQRRMHKRAMPKFGGPAVILGFLVSVIYLLIVMSMEKTIDLFGPEKYGTKLLGMFLGIIVIAITCIIDDIKGIKPIVKLSGQVVAAIIAVSFGIKIDDVTIPFINNPELQEVFSVILTILWMAGITNAINLIDGLDRFIIRNICNFCNIIANNICIKWFSTSINIISNSFSRSISWIFTI